MTFITKFEQHLSRCGVYDKYLYMVCSTMHNDRCHASGYLHYIIKIDLFVVFFCDLVECLKKGIYTMQKCANLLRKMTLSNRAKIKMCVSTIFGPDWQIHAVVENECEE